MVAPYVPYSHTKLVKAMVPRPSQWGGGFMEVTKWRVTQNGTRQGFPHLTPTSYSKREYWLVKGDTDADSWSWSESEDWCLRTQTESDNQAYTKFVGKLGDASSFGATLTAELKQTWGTVVGIIERLLLAAREAKKMNPRGVATALGLPYAERTVRRVRWTHRKDGSRKRRVVSRQRYIRLPNGRWVLKSAGSGWLLFSYGVKPLCEDIYNGMDVLQRPLPFMKVNAKGKSKRERVDVYDGGLIYLKRLFSAETRCSAKVSVSNPNLWLCNQMGLINPVQWLNEAIPFSFVVDWFSNLSAVISSMTDFVGLNIAEPCTTWLYKSNETSILSYPPSWGYTTRINEKERVGFWRYLQLPQVKLHFAYERFSWQRGLNAVSLLLGFLPRK